MSDAWEEIQAVKSKRNSLRERLEKRKKERQDILGTSLGKKTTSSTTLSDDTGASLTSIKEETKSDPSEDDDMIKIKIDPGLEKELLKLLSEVTLQIPISSEELSLKLKNATDENTQQKQVCNLLQKFATQKLITVKDMKDGKFNISVTYVEVSKVNAMIAEFYEDINVIESERKQKKKRDLSPDKKNSEDEDRKKREKKEPKADIMVISCESNNEV